MASLSPLFHWLIPRASARVIDDTNLGNGAGIESMWDRICTTLPFCDIGAQAPEFFLEKVTTIVTGLIVGIGVIILIYQGIKLMTTEGDDQGLAETKKTLIYTVGGMLLALMARAIVLYVAEDLIPRLAG